MNSRLFTRSPREGGIDVALGARLEDVGCSPSLRAAACRPRDWGLAWVGLVGLTSRANVVAVGTISCSSSSRFGPTFAVSSVTPVRLPPGRFSWRRAKLQRHLVPGARKIDQRLLLLFGFGFAGRTKGLVGILPARLFGRHRALDTFDDGGTGSPSFSSCSAQYCTLMPAMV
jgi:hypothetical protein